MSNRVCCCGPGSCVNPSGTHYIDVNVIIDANVPTAPFGGTQSIYFSEVWDLEYSGTNLVTANSSVRFRAEWHADLRYPDNSIFSQWDRVIDVTLVPVGGDWFCGQAAAQYCEDCLSKGNFRLDPRVRLPHLVNGVQLGSITINAYTNTAAGAASGGWDGVTVGWSTSVGGGQWNAYAQWGRDDSANIVQPTFVTGTGVSNTYPDNYPAVVYRQPPGYGICTPISHNQIAPPGIYTTPALAWTRIVPGCPSDKAVLEKQGYVFNAYTRTATLT